LFLGAVNEIQEELLNMLICGTTLGPENPFLSKATRCAPPCGKDCVLFVLRDRGLFWGFCSGSTAYFKEESFPSASGFRASPGVGNPGY
jgi:hypothetical protein